MRSANQFDAVTVDAFGTLLELEDPTERLRSALGALGIHRDAATVRAAFRAEAAYYRPRSLRGSDPARLAELRAECVQVFLDRVGAGLDAESFVDPFVESIVFRLVPGGRAALDALAGAGLALACVANWDLSLIEHLDRLGVTQRFAAILPSALVGVEKPDARLFEEALRKLGVSADRALHIGDDAVDRDGAAAAGLAFAEPPLPSLPGRLGL
jgi:putative hydrolase of the HAD superfamily